MWPFSSSSPGSLNFRKIAPDFAIAGQLDPADIETQIGPLIVKYASVAGMPERAPATGSMDRFSGIRMGDDAPSGLMQ